jgi:CP family cyanate transporter-like MFS transporter
VTAGLALVPWVALAVSADPRPVAHGEPAILVRALVHSRVAWWLALFFGAQSAQAYIVTSWLSQIVVDAGGDVSRGGYAVGVFAALGIPMSAIVPALLRQRLPVVIVLLGLCYIAGYGGLLVAPRSGLWWWAVLIGVGTTSFPLALTLIALRARTTPGVAALSAFTQSVGYAVAAAGPIAIGALHDVAGGWGLPLIALMGIAAFMVFAGLRAAQPRVVEDDLQPVA